VGCGRAVCGERESGREGRPRSPHTLAKIIKKQAPHPVLHVWYLTYKTEVQSYPDDILVNNYIWLQ